ncbi:MAG: hypothetical protein RRB13_00185 [bacterium]|nr:hypothetical protein [bacterium]
MIKTTHKLWLVTLGLVFSVFLIGVPTQSALALIGERPPAPSDKSVPYRKAFKCYGKWVKSKRQVMSRDGYSVPHVGYKCVDDPSIRKKMVESGQ